MASFLQAVFFYLSCMVSGIAGISLLSGTSAGWRWTFYVGTVLGLCYSLIYLMGSGHVLQYPILQRWRYFRLKQRMLPCVVQAVTTATAAMATALLLSALPQLPTAPLYPPLLISQWLAAVLTAWLWHLAAEVLQVVYTERVQLSSEGDIDAVGPLVQGLRCSSNPIFQDWALLDLTYLAEQCAEGGGRRRGVFAPEPGRPGWRELSTFLLGQLMDTTQALKQALPSLAGAAKAAAAPDAGPVWNRRHVVQGLGPSASDKHALASWCLEAQQQRIAWSVRVLAALAAASLEEDKLGTLLLEQPSLGDVLLVLLDLLLALQQYSRTMSVYTKRRGSAPAGSIGQLLAGCSHGARVDGAALALLDNVRVAVYQLVATFDGLQGVLRGAKQPPLYAEVRQLEAALEGFVAGRQ